MLYWIIIFFIILGFAYDEILSWLNIQASRKPVPDNLKDIYDKQEYERQQRYASEKRHLSMISGGVETLAGLAVFSLGGLAIVDSLVGGLTSSPILKSVFFILVFMWASNIIGLPFAYRETFNIEQKFGFNRSTPRLFLSDWVKGNMLSSCLTGGLMALFVWLYSLMPDYYWITAWTVMVSFMLVLQLVYSTLIVPLFNKQKPLEEGELRSAIQKFARKVDFKLKDIYVMDGSKRSSKANAYFTGFGPSKRIVLYDTLIEQLTTDEIVGVLAHEIGHYKHRHIIWHMVMSWIQLLILFFVLNLFLSSQSLAEAAGCESPSFHVNLMVFMLLVSPLMNLIGFFENMVLRRSEWQADEFARANGLGQAEAEGLKKLSRNSLGNLTPHPFVVAMEYSHPPLKDRIKHLQS